MAKLACRAYYSDGDRDSFTVALGAISSRIERIQVLSNLDESFQCFLSDIPWGKHRCFSTQSMSQKIKSKKINLTDVLVKELIDDGQIIRASEILEERGQLIEASKKLDELNTIDSKCRRTELLSCYTSIILSLENWSVHRDELLKVVECLEPSLGEHTPYIKSIALAKINNTEQNVFDSLDVCKVSTIWKFTSIMMALETIGLNTLLNRMPGSDIWFRVFFLTTTVREMRLIASLLQKSSLRSIEEE
eukprot:CAMPEP_0113326784 /NCGR_PEP_ID=MMETSP0010_2-20120614/18785_1 /TAXON_ID=216773 ORGANISM="Corethron hystrix, Strain 308" /NCGR_SAMPLE_ID=MMETSP0010_2 /ASSEMBLY_ACC=CAM_ASM_000155 /LENGTH=247 /DNA_ID=CAMNT_0000187297 /DNA_START=57 /DNA_END=797 /DNA_ORIENTATION=- /assembly_acc=CAM_ASM_000155